ncbi:TonB-dependent receptor [Pedobacter miscanthi]|jgi:TonB-linked SusC/RagA family outer membrane protein|uniref:SusC/RagA family TonB-linked outer membrane protein n=1 Tax=Pedobacter miscanthi TaxID=2259170 RepID=UPI002931A9E8|nr:TonB-dependent receptor [Pedobacter miscanthi]
MKKFLLYILCLLSFQISYAQEIITVKGTVKDAKEQPIPGATISEKGKANAVITDNNGNYQIKVSKDAALVFKYLGTKTVERKVEGRTTISVILVDEANSLNDVVVVGYGQTTRRGDLTGAISSVKGEEIAKTPIQNVAQALQGRVAGLQISMPDGTPGATPSITLRGGMSITQSNEPLYVVDGVPQTDGLAFLDPTDIESVDVMKDASSTSIYGARGANGVILITTKKIRAGKIRISYDNYIGVKAITRELPLFNSYEYALAQYEVAANSTNATVIDKITKAYGPFADLQKNFLNRPGNNYQDLLLGKNAMNQYHKFSFSGGSNETQFNAFYSHNQDEGIMVGSGSDKDIAKLTLTHNLNNKLTVSAIVNYSNQKTTGIGTNDGGNTRLSFLQNVLQYRPIIGLVGSDEDLLSGNIDPLDPNPSSPTFQDPVTAAQSSLRERRQRSLNMNATLQYKFLKNLTYRGLVSYSDNGDKTKEFTEAASAVAIRSGGPFGAIRQSVSTRFNYNNTLTYANTFAKDHKLDVTLGQEYIYNYNEGLSFRASAFPTENLGWDNFGFATLSDIPVTSAEDDKMLSFFGRANYSYKGKYLLTSSLRYDGSSKFGPENRWGVFPSVAVAWKIINEDFMKSFKNLSELKLRFSYGVAGNNRIDNYLALGTFGNLSYPLKNQPVIGVGLNALSNPALKWEALQSTNLGLDIGLFKQRITMTAELYNNKSKDLLYRSRIPASSGFATQLRNIGSTSSKGLELTLNTVNVASKNFSWNSTLNFAFNKTKVLELSDNESSMVVPSYTTTNDYILQVGESVGNMYGWVQDGLYQVSDFNYDPTTNVYTLKSGVVTDAVTPRPGFLKYKDLNGDGKIDNNDRTILGNGNPKFTGGLNNTFSYKGIDLSVFINFVTGNKVYNANRLNMQIIGEYGNAFSYQSNRWTTINANGQLATPAEQEALNQGKTIPRTIGSTDRRLYDQMVEDGSFLRINNVSLGYTFPKRWLSAVKIDRLRIYVTAYNLYVFSKYSGYDPEVSAIRGALTPSVDFSAYPRARSIVAGLNVSL